MKRFINRYFSLILVLTSILAPLAAQAAEVNVYSYRQSFLVQPMFDAFSRQSGIGVNIVYAKKGLLERLKNEGANSPADLVFTVDVGRLTEIVAAGLSQPVESKTINDNIPENYREKDNHWFGLTSHARIIVMSKTRVKEGEVTRYEDLANQSLRERVCTRSGKHAYTVALTASMIAHHGMDKASNWLQGVKNNLARKPQGNDRAQVKAIKEGECDIAVINHYYMTKMLEDPEQKPWADAVSVVFPNQGDRGTHMNISGMLLTKSAPNKDNAIKLMEFLSSDQAQSMYAQVNGEYPLKDGVPWSDLQNSWGRFKTDDLNLTDVAALRGAAIKLADKVGYDG